MKTDRGLTPKQERFAREYLIDHNGTQAAIRAGYSPKGADVAAARLLGNIRVGTFLRGLTLETTKRLNLTADMVLEGLYAEATRADEGSSHAARVSAWKALGEHLALFTQRVDHTTQGQPLVLGNPWRDE